MPEDPVQRALFDTGMAWAEDYKEALEEVDIYNEGLHLFGRYYDFGADSAVIILPGRMESCLYSLYFAEPYRAAGRNVLVIDNRAHGLSDGRYNSLGHHEHKDVIKWAEFLRDEKGIRDIVLHGCCIGAANAVFTATDKNCPEEVKALITEGMFATFSESFKNHLIKEKKPVFPFKLGFSLIVRLVTGADILHDGPYYRIPALKIPILMLHSREDIFSLPEKAQVLYDRCGSEKKIVWFDRGEHSRIRFADREAYDCAIGDFLSGIRRN